MPWQTYSSLQRRTLPCWLKRRQLVFQERSLSLGCSFSPPWLPWVCWLQQVSQLILTLEAKNFSGHSNIVFSVMVNNTTGWISPHHSTNFLDKLSLSLGLQEHVYTVVIDAGSTGSRVLAFTFHRSLSGLSSLSAYSSSLFLTCLFHCRSKRKAWPRILFTYQTWIVCFRWRPQESGRLDQATSRQSQTSSPFTPLAPNSPST